MPKIAYIEHKFKASTKEMIEQANSIIAEYQAQGLVLTLRQLYYQFVSRDLLKNTVKEYKRLGGAINDGRMAGLIDWDAIEDRTRNLVGNSHWSEPQSIIYTAANSYEIDKWADQDTRVEVWVEKEALAGVFENACQPLDIPIFACRGYVSQSEMWGAAIRLRKYERAGQNCVILHFGDHDPSGIDMTRDIKDRLHIFGCNRTEIRRMALNFDQIEEYSPPPNPAKQTDSRFEAYQVQFGDESWELDALNPTTLRDLIQDGVFTYRDVDKWEEAVRKEELEKKQLETVAERWEEVVEHLEVT